ncbi:MAG TPA: DUF6134 family protein [Phenylobacterium sp.]|jgi:hypothetical protein
MSSLKAAFSRRAVLAGGLILPLAPRLALAAPKGLTFAVFRNNAHIGEHHMAFAGEGDSLTATTQADMLVKLGPVPVFRYRHQAVERRAGGAFARLETSTVTNGKTEHVVAEKTGGGIAVDCPSGRTVLSADSNPMTHWNPKIFEGPLFNPQTGKMLKVRTARAGANRWTIRGEVEMDDTYDDAGAWLAAKAKGDDGSTIEYRRI